MIKRDIIKIDEEKCTGCGECIPNCAEGAISIVDGVAKLIDDKYCDGLGACLGHCPEGALEIVEREAAPFDEEAVEQLLSKGKGEPAGTCPSFGGCPGSAAQEFSREDRNFNDIDEFVSNSDDVYISIKSQLDQWPVHLALVPGEGRLWKGANLLVTASCVPVAYPNFHLDLLKGKRVVYGCPKFDDVNFYVQKLAEIIAHNHIRTITVAYMEVPCCIGMLMAVEHGLKASGKDISIHRVKISIKGEVLT